MKAERKRVSAEEDALGRSHWKKLPSWVKILVWSARTLALLTGLVAVFWVMISLGSGPISHVCFFVGLSSLFLFIASFGLVRSSRWTGFFIRGAGLAGGAAVIFLVIFFLLGRPGGGHDNTGPAIVAFWAWLVFVMILFLPANFKNQEIRAILSGTAQVSARQLNFSRIMKGGILVLVLYLVGMYIMLDMDQARKLEDSKATAEREERDRIHDPARPAAIELMKQITWGPEEGKMNWNGSSYWSGDEENAESAFIVDKVAEARPKSYDFYYVRCRY